MHHEPIAFVVLELAFILILGLLGRFAARKLNQPEVLGELLVGIAAATIMWSIKSAGFSRMIADLDIFASLGVILLLFGVGLETKVADIMKVGKTAMLVALIGVAVPAITGWGSAKMLLGMAGSTTHLFIAAALCATSVGITARVFRDLKKLNSPEAKIILGAAVIDDVLGLIILAVVSGIATSGQLSVGPVTKIIALSIAFFTIVILGGPYTTRTVARHLRFLDPKKFALYFALIVCFVLSWMASEIGLAAIVGAFAAGLILEEKEFPGLTETLAPIESLFTPVFFVLMGLQVNLASFLDIRIAGLAIVLTVVGVLGKLACALPVPKNLDRLTVGIGMVPRGEVGLIFAAAGKSLGVLSDGVFSSVVIMTVLTTVLTPPALRWSMARAAAYK